MMDNLSKQMFLQEFENELPMMEHTGATGFNGIPLNILSLVIDVVNRTLADWGYELIEKQVLLDLFEPEFWIWDGKYGEMATIESILGRVRNFFPA